MTTQTNRDAALYSYRSFTTERLLEIASAPIAKGTIAEGLAREVLAEREAEDEASAAFTAEELDQLASALRIVIDTHGAQVLPETLERMRALRSKVLQIAFMETCRDA